MTSPPPPPFFFFLEHSSPFLFKDIYKWNGFLHKLKQNSWHKQDSGSVHSSYRNTPPPRKLSLLRYDTIRYDNFIYTRYFHQLIKLIIYSNVSIYLTTLKFINNNSNNNYSRGEGRNRISEGQHEGKFLLYTDQAKKKVIKVLIHLFYTNKYLKNLKHFQIMNQTRWWKQKKKNLWSISRHNLDYLLSRASWR